jgi:hypothetical protein
MHLKPILFSVALFGVPELTLAQTRAQYTVTFESTWSAETHPSDFPENPHFSGLIGGVHNDKAMFWAPGDTASVGIELMAETGNKTALNTEVETTIDNGSTGAVLSGSGIGRSPGAVSLDFEASETYPLVSLVSMIAPSPDWFVGVHDLNLFDGGDWVEEMIVELFAYDAGTDSGTSYTAANADTQPRESIALIETEPFVVDDTVRSVGTFTFTRTAVIASAADEHPETAASAVVINTYPNPFADHTTIDIQVTKREFVRVNVYDMLGRHITTLFAGTLRSGSTHQVVFQPGALPAGTYVIHIQGETFSTVRLVVKG